MNEAGNNSVTHRVIAEEEAVEREAPEEEGRDRALPRLVHGAVALAGRVEDGVPEEGERLLLAAVAAGTSPFFSSATPRR